MLWAWWPVHSTSELAKIYTIRVYRYPDRVTCDCKGNRTQGRCKHIRFYKALIKALLHGKQGV